jgi:hypothetical protein
MRRPISIVALLAAVVLAVLNSKKLVDRERIGTLAASQRAVPYLVIPMG